MYLLTFFAWNIVAQKLTEVHIFITSPGIPNIFDKTLELIRNTPFKFRW